MNHPQLSLDHLDVFGKADRNNTFSTKLRNPCFPAPNKLTYLHYSDLHQIQDSSWEERFSVSGELSDEELTGRYTLVGALDADEMRFSGDGAICSHVMKRETRENRRNQNRLWEIKILFLGFDLSLFP